jgi:hypothetical protein
MDLNEAGCQAHFLLRDRDGKFPALMDEVLAEAGITTCGTPCASTNTSTTSTEPTKP